SLPAQGFEGTTVTQIADEARLTERTFFRYYADKREVLFVDRSASRASSSPGSPARPATDPMELVAAAITGAAAFFPDEKRSWSRARAQVLADNDALMECELHKMSALAETLGETLVS